MQITRFCTLYEWLFILTQTWCFLLICVKLFTTRASYFNCRKIHHLYTNFVDRSLTVDPNDLQPVKKQPEEEVLKEIYTGRGFFLGEVKPIQKPPSENIRALWERIIIYRSVYVTLHSSSPNYLFAKFFNHLHKKTNSCTSLQIRLKSDFSFQTIIFCPFFGLEI